MYKTKFSSTVALIACVFCTLLLTSCNSCKSSFQTPGGGIEDPVVHTHPCGIAVSQSGMVAVSTFEGDHEPGYIYVWKSFADFNGGSIGADFTIQGIIDPEAVCFDDNATNPTLFISSTSGSKIYYTTDFSKTPINSIQIAGAVANASEPRGIRFFNGSLYVMCENSGVPSYVRRVKNLTASSPGFVKVSGTDQYTDNALDVCFNTGNNNYMFTADYNNNYINGDPNQPDAGYVRMFNTTNGGASYGPGPYRDLRVDDGNGNLAKPTAVVSVGNETYFTTNGGYVVKWDYTKGNTPDNTYGDSLHVPVDGQLDEANAQDLRGYQLVPWGIAYYKDNSGKEYLLVTNAASFAVQTYDLNLNKLQSTEVKMEVKERYVN
jgi:hypothetical protein